MLSPQKPRPTGTLALTKGKSQAVAKPSHGAFTVTATWKNKKSGLLGGKKLDYDVYAHVAYVDGTKEVINFDKLVSRNGTVRHHGDLRTGGTEIISVELSPDIAAVGFSLYSARENGTGSFADAQAAVSIDNGEGSKITLGVSQMNVDPRSYTLYFGTIINRGPNAVDVVACEDYSARNSERRPVLRADGTHTMDAGPENRHKS